MDIATIIGQWQVVSSAKAVLTTPTKLVDANPRRYALGIGLRQTAVSPTPADEYIIWAVEPGVNLDGFVLLDNATIWLNLKDHPGLVNSAIYAQAHTVNPFIHAYIIELVQSSVPDR